MEAFSTVVIKVKYGKILRRFNAQIVDGELDLGMDGLKAKIFSLFTIAPDPELRITYIDEDGDVVSLVDADDIRDVVKQGLNPLRITVKLSSEKNARQFNHASGNSTPLRSPTVQEPLQNLNAGVPEVLKTIPEPLRDAMMKLSTDLASKASSSAPLITELVDHFSKVGLSYLGQLSESQATMQPSTDSDVPENKEDQSLKSNESLAKPQPEVFNENRVNLVKVTGGSTDASSSKTSNVVPSPEDSRNISIGKKEKVKKISECVGKLGGRPYGGNRIRKIGGLKASEHHAGLKTVDGYVGSFWATNPGKSNFPGTYSGPTPSYGCPFSGPYSHGDLLKRSSSQNDGSRNIFHHGVRCDVCGVHPITGSRFKSKVKVDYDLCSICFSEMGNESDYIRMDRPVASGHPMSLKGMYDSVPMPPQVLQCGPKLDSHFIQDVNVIDGTTMEPLTPFTKIWRMRNNGMVEWPARTQLVWIGGDKLSDQCSVEVEIPAAGLQIGQELDVSVDCIAPELPGGYISYWRMASPSGQKFGQRVWLLIQVHASVSPRESIRDLNLNLPPAAGPEIINVNAEPTVEDSHPAPDNSKKSVELVEPVYNFQPNKEHEMKFPINDSLLVGTGAPKPGASGPVPLAGVYSLEPAMNILEPSPPVLVTTQQSRVELTGKKEVEEKLLRELEEMGFKQVDLNKHVLRMTEYDLDQAVDELCGVAEWDPILEELQEMGFHDTEMNKMLLKKNNGSIKRVVMDLIAGEKI